MKRRKIKPIEIIYRILTGLVVVFFLFPIFMIVITSLKSRVDALAVPPVWIFKPSFSNYLEIFSMYNFAFFFRNSLIVATLGTLVAVVLGVPAAYSLARHSFSGESNLSFWILSQRMTPAIAVIIPFFILLRTFGLIDSHLGLIIIYTSFNLPFIIWMMRGFFEDIPVEIEESALVDGCSRFGTFFRVALPLVAPGLSAAAIFTFLFTWNEFLFALILTGRNAETMPVAVQLFMRETGIDWGHMTAAAVVMIVPMMIFTFFAQRFLVRGLTFGAIK
jgi:multiple sugar transport system permease protein